VWGLGEEQRTMLKMPENHERQGFYASKSKSGKEKMRKKKVGVL
jgi:hypothetical protein